MKTASRFMRQTQRLALAALAAMAFSGIARADETCNSPYMSGLIKGQEDYVHVWTLGVAGLGDGYDKLVTIDVNPKSKTYGKVVHKVSVGARGEAHHMGFTDDRRYLWAGGLNDSKIYVFDVGTNPAKPKLIKTIADLPAKTGYVGPHTFYAMPGRMLIGTLSNTKDNGGVTGIAVYNNKGGFVAKYDIPTTKIGDVQGDGYGYDIAINPSKNAMLTSSFAGRENYMRDIGSLIKDEAAMKKFGNTMVLWDLKAMQPRQIFSVPGAPLEIRWSLNPGDDWAITATALTSKLWLVKQDGAGKWQAKEVGNDRRPEQNSAAGGHFDYRRRQGAMGQYVLRRPDALLRSQQPGGAKADVREADRTPGQYDQPVLGRQARLCHFQPAREVGQRWRRQRTVPACV